MKEWIEEEFATAELGDERLLKRMKLIVDRLFENPMASMKSAFRGWAEVMGAYRFYNNPKSRIEAVIGPHRDATLQRIKQHRRVLHIQDTSEIDYTLKKKLRGAGPLSSTDRQGFFAHTQYVVSEERLPLGVWKTQIWARDEAEHGRSDQRKKKPIEAKESFRWLEGYRDACVLASLAPETTVVSCADREGDIYEVFTDWRQRLERGQPAAEWLIRCNQNRRLAPGSDAEDDTRKIREKIAASPVLGALSVPIRAKEQYKKIKGGNRKKVKRSARTATLEVRAGTVQLRPPYRPDRKLPTLGFQVVMATEKDPPADEDPIDWVLLSSLPIADFNAAVELIDLYRGRWEIEDFHRVLKSGCKIEELQLKNDEPTKVAIALYMVVAWRVVYVMKLGRECPNLPCDVVFEQDEWQAVWGVCHGEEAIEKKPTLGQFVITVARLGGFLARSADGHPGAQAMWQGLRRVQDFTLAWQVHTKKRGPLLGPAPAC